MHVRFQCRINMRGQLITLMQTIHTKQLRYRLLPLFDARPLAGMGFVYENLYPGFGT